MPGYLIASYILVILLFLTAITYLICKVKINWRTFAKSSVFFIIIYALSFAAWFLLKTQIKGTKDWVTNLFDSFVRAAKGFALSNEEKDIFENTDYAFGGVDWYTFTKIMMLYIGQVGSLIFASVAVIAGVFKIAVSKKDNSSVNWRFLRHMSAKNSFSNNVLITDLDYIHIKPFLDNMTANKHSKIKVIVPANFYATQAGQELVEILRLRMIDTYIECINVKVIIKFAHYIFPFFRNVNFYSMLFHDLDNLEFAKVANDYLKTHRGKKKNKQKTVNFYISYQDEEFAMNFELEKESHGAIQLVNEYDWVACKFVYENPITRFIQPCEDKKTLIKALSNQPNIHVHFFGFGMINKALLKRMFPNYQLPANSQVHYHILDKVAGSEHFDQSFLARYTALGEIFKNEKFLPQYDFNQYFDARDIDLNSDSELFAYLKEQVEIIKAMDEEKRLNTTNLIFIALGDMQHNAQIANKIRTFVKLISQAEDNVILQNSYIKSFIIYPYIKDNDFFKCSPSVDEEIYQKLKDKKLDEIPDALHALYDKDVYGKEFNGHLLYVFENKYRKQEYIAGKNSKKNNDEALLKSAIKHEEFKREECPIVVIGRGGYISDPLRGLILKIAKHANNSYHNIYANKGKGGSLVDAADEKWFSGRTNYPKKQTNIGVALTMQTKLNIVGYELKWDKDDVLGKYLKIKDNPEKAKAFLETNQERYRGYFASINGKDFLEDLGYVHEMAGYEGIDFTNIKPLLSKELQKRLKGLTLNIVNLKNAFLDEYQQAYLDYYNDKANMNDKILNMVQDYYFIVYQSINNEYLSLLTEMEHRRWYVESARYGIVPRPNVPPSYTFDGKTKSDDGVANVCMTDEVGLLGFAKGTFTKMVEERKIFGEENEYVEIVNARIENDISAFNFDRNNANHGPFKSVFRTIFEYDLLAYLNSEKLYNIEKEHVGTKYRLVFRKREIRK